VESDEANEDSEERSLHHGCHKNWRWTAEPHSTETADNDRGGQKSNSPANPHWTADHSAKSSNDRGGKKSNSQEILGEQSYLIAADWCQSHPKLLSISPSFAEQQPGNLLP
jgi:hypothetical protein